MPEHKDRTSDIATMKHMVSMGIKSLSPEKFDMLEQVIVELCRSRQIDPEMIFRESLPE